MEIMQKEGGDLDEIMHRVRAKTVATRDYIVEEYKKGNIPDSNDDDEGDEKTRSN